MAESSLLIECCQAGDEHAQESLYNCHWESVFRLACGLLGDPSDAEEVALDSLTYALSHIAQYDPTRSGFSTWLHMITVSRCRNQLHRRYLPWLSLTEWLRQGNDVHDPAPNPEARTIHRETRSQVWEAVQSLSLALREAVLLRYWAGHTYQEMAHILGCPISTAQSRVRLASQRLREILAPAMAADWEQEGVR
jgi:RNA polymerase sigma-70 factor (ECF subfamily)